MLEKPKKKLDTYMKYSGMAFQMMGILLLSGWIGGKIDAYYGFEKHYVTAGLMLFMLVTYLWKIVLETNNERKK